MQATLAELAALVGGQIIGDGELLILGAATLRDAEPGHVTLVDQVEKAHLLGQCRAAAVVAPRDFKPSDLPTILVDNVHLAFAAIVRTFARPIRRAESASVRRPASAPPLKSATTLTSIPLPPSATAL